MNEQGQERIKQLLKEAVQPMSNRGDRELRCDLWPAMVRRLQARPARVPWFDWALLAAVAACLAFFPGAIPVLLYYL